MGRRVKKRRSGRKEGTGNGMIVRKKGGVARKSIKQDEEEEKGNKRKLNENTKKSYRVEIGIKRRKGEESSKVEYTKAERRVKTVGKGMMGGGKEELIWYHFKLVITTQSWKKKTW